MKQLIIKIIVKQTNQLISSQNRQVILSKNKANKQQTSKTTCKDQYCFLCKKTRIINQQNKFQLTLKMIRQQKTAQKKSYKIVYKERQIRNNQHRLQKCQMNNHFYRIFKQLIKFKMEQKNILKIKNNDFQNKFIKDSIIIIFLLFIFLETVIFQKIIIMIVPYYNTIILGYESYKLIFDKQQQQLIKQCLGCFIRDKAQNQSNQYQITIKIQQTQPTKCNMTSQLKKIIQNWILNLPRPIYPLHNGYTINQQKYEYITALRQLNLQQKDEKSPITIKNIEKLQAYFNRYKDSHNLKYFLKELLINQINHNKKMIKYNKLNQVNNKIKQLINSIQGNIQIIQQFNNNNHNNNYNNNKICQMKHQYCFYLILIDSSQIKYHNLIQIIQYVQSYAVIDRNINVEVTNQYTNCFLKKICQQKISIMINRMYFIGFQSAILSIKQLKQSLTVVSNLKAILIYGMKMAQLQRRQRQQFLQFVKEMNLKYTKQCCNYLQSFHQQINYVKQRQRYVLTQLNMLKLNKYLKGLRQRMIYNKILMIWKVNKCKMIQNRIKGYLTKRRLYKNMMQSYLRQKYQQNNSNTKSYNKIIQFSNECQLTKFNLSNKFKYGFSCYLQILSIKNHYNQPTFNPQLLLTLIEKVNKNNRELIAKIKCQNNAIQIYNIEGKVFRLGFSPEYQNYNYCYNTQNKQNMANQINNFTRKLDNSNSKTFKINQSQKTSLYQSNKSFNCHSIKKNSWNIIKNQTYQFRIENNCKLYGRGCNKFGQLGLGSCKYYQQWTFVFQNVKIVTTCNFHTFIVTNDNKIFHFGKQLSQLKSTFEPTQYKLIQKLHISQVLISTSEIYILTENNKLFSLFPEKYIRIPKQVQLQLETFDLIKTESKDIQIVYLLGYWTNTLDKLKKKEIRQYLLTNNKTIRSLYDSHLLKNSKSQYQDNYNQSFLMEDNNNDDSMGRYDHGYKNNCIYELSSIIEENQ